MVEDRESPFFNFQFVVYVLALTVAGSRSLVTELIAHERDQLEAMRLVCLKQIFKARVVLKLEASGGCNIDDDGSFGLKIGQRSVLAIHLLRQVPK